MHTDLEYPVSWYPLCASHALKPGCVFSVSAFGERLALFRTDDGAIGAVKAQCCHIGADLSRGEVIDGLLHCPLHRWAFDTTGVCRHIPCQADIPKRARQAVLQCREYAGIVFGLLGEGQVEDFPLDRVTGEVVHSTPRHLDFAAPYEMAAVNSFDEQHLAAVHRREVIGKQEISSHSADHFAIEYRAKVTPYTLYDKMLHLIGKQEVHMRLDCWGGNLLLFSHLGTLNRMLIALLPQGENQSRAFIVTLLPEAHYVLWRPLQKLAATVLNKFTMLFVQQDVKALQGIDFKLINVLPEADATLIKWYQYWKRQPRTSFTDRSEGIIFPFRR